jgi:peptidoglycan/xylan/chitin deacetylase (PgdA/CDA1 family)/GT2 family glycosyltransferase
MAMISIVIPALNEERFIAECLESLKNQDYPGEYEIIVADNGSTDSTADIARDYGAKVIRCLEKKSVTYARQVGAYAAHGDIIAQADADTVYPRDWLSKIADHFSTHPDAAALAGRFLYKDPPSWAWFEYFLRDWINRFSARLIGRPMLVSGATFAFRKSAFVDIGGYSGASFSADQLGISGQLSKAGKVYYDRDFHVLTSSRSVRKPLLVCIMEGEGHVARWVGYMGKSYANSLEEFANRTAFRRVAFRVSPVALIVIVLAYGYFIPTSPVFGKVYYKGDNHHKVIALTFDDGPNEPYTSEVLDILDKYDIKATFFCVGKNVELYPETAKRIVAEGHVLGNHSNTHDANHALSEFGAKDLVAAERAISDTVGVEPHLYRPPHGKKSPWELDAVKDQGMIEVTWSVSTGELNTHSFERVADRLVDETHPGEIMLLHDGYGTSHNCEQADKSLTVEALPLIIERLKAEGYTFVTVPELLDVPAYNNN